MALRFGDDKSNCVICLSIYARGVDSRPSANATLLRLSITDFDYFNACVCEALFHQQTVVFYRLNFFFRHPTEEN